MHCKSVCKINTNAKLCIHCDILPAWVAIILETYLGENSLKAISFKSNVTCNLIKKQ